MVSKIKVLTKLATKGYAKTGNISLSYAIRKSVLGDKPVWIIEDGTRVQEEFDFENVDEAVDRFLELLPKAVDLSTIPDAFELKKVNYAEREYQFKQWCAEHSDALSTIAASIGIANQTGSRTIWFDVPHSEVDNYVRFFRKRHYKVCKQRFSESEGISRVTLDWNITDNDKTRLRDTYQC